MGPRYKKEHRRSSNFDKLNNALPTTSFLNLTRPQLSGLSDGDCRPSFFTCQAYILFRVYYKTTYIIVLLI